jgi:predicted metal-dependent hydrolase
MTIETSQVVVSGIPIQIVRKPIKNLHLGVYPPNGRVRVAAPLRINDNAVRLAVIQRLKWIRRQQARFESQLRESQREMVTGESHYVFGTRYRLRVIQRDDARGARLRNRSRLELFVPRGADATQKQRILQRWYRSQLKDAVPPLLSKWQSIFGLQVSDWRIRRMKTKWGACNVEAQRICINLELAKKPVQCLEYVIAHELTHFLERHHNDRFVAILDRHVPHWRAHRSKLNSAPLAHERWKRHDKTDRS